MVKCPDCKRESAEHNKKWKYGRYDVESYLCECGTDFRSYKQEGIEKFKLKKNKTDKHYQKP